MSIICGPWTQENEKIKIRMTRNQYYIDIMLGIPGKLYRCKVAGVHWTLAKLNELSLTPL